MALHKLGIALRAKGALPIPRTQSLQRIIRTPHTEKAQKYPFLWRTQ